MIAPDPSLAPQREQAAGSASDAPGPGESSAATLSTTTNANNNSRTTSGAGAKKAVVGAGGGNGNAINSSSINSASVKSPAALMASKAGYLSPSSDIVRALFGDAVGPCWGDFFCTHNRIRGRLYATSRAILFYSNLLGFERRLSFFYHDVEEVTLYRSTSISISLVDGETYIFKSFNNREQVVELLLGLKSLLDRHDRSSRSRSAATDPAPSSCSAPVSPVPDQPPHDSFGAAGNANLPPASGLRTVSSSSSLNNLSSSADVPTQPTSPVKAPPPSIPPANAARRRAVSDSLVKVPKAEPYEMHPARRAFIGETSDLVAGRGPAGAVAAAAAAAAAEQPCAMLDETQDDVFPLRLDNNFGNGFGASYHSSNNFDDEELLKEAWEKAKGPKDPPLEEVGIDSLLLPCSVEVFFEAFLANDSPHSLARYQREYIKDKHVKASVWEMCEDDESDAYYGMADYEVLSRTITFVHPIKNSMGVGPTEARTTRKQRLRRFPGYGMTLENTTLVEGVPNSDAFCVQDQWVFEAGDPGANELVLSASFDTRFNKRVLLKNIMQKSIRKETKEWFARYVRMVQEALLQKQKQEEDMRPVEVRGVERSVEETEDSSTTRPEVTEVQGEEVVEQSAAAPVTLDALVASLQRLTWMVSLILALLFLLALVQLMTMQETVAALRQEVEVLRMQQKLLAMQLKAEPT